MSLLFEPTRIGNFDIKNRFIRSATYYALSDPDGFISEDSIDLMKKLAASHIGLIVTGNAFVAKHGQVFPDMNGIDSDGHIEGLKRMTKAVHEEGGKIVMQVAHGGSGARTAAKNHGKYLAVSVVGALANKTRPPVEMTDEDIEEIIDAFGRAARRVREAGFDGVQIHGAHGYLVSQFLSPRANRRNDRWGGSLENRARFAVEAARAMRKAAGEDFPVMIKLGCRDYVDGDDGLSIDEGSEVARLLEREGVCHIEVSHGIMDKAKNKQLSAVITPDREAFMLPDARAVREKTTVPISLVGGFRSLRVMEAAINSGACDHISICRSLIREPDLVLKYERGEAETAECISCGGCFNIDDSGKMHIYCRQKKAG